MMIGGRRRPVLPSMPCTSLPQMPQARTSTSTSPGSDVRLRHVLDFQTVVLGQNEGLHHVSECTLQIPFDKWGPHG